MVKLPNAAHGSRAALEQPAAVQRTWQLAAAAAAVTAAAAVGEEQRYEQPAVARAAPSSSQKCANSVCKVILYM